MPRLAYSALWAALALSVIVSPLAVAQPAHGRHLTAEVVAIDQVIMLNRLGASLPQGMMFALRRDVVPSDCYNGNADCTATAHAPFVLQPGKVMLRRDKRPRPIVLRMNTGDTLTIRFWNLLNPNPASTPGSGLLPATRTASMHLMGAEWTSSSADDGSFAGANASSLMPPTPTSSAPQVYTLQAHMEGSFLLYSTAANVGGAGGLVDGAQLDCGLFGALNVEPAQSVWYRSQVTHEELGYATTGRTADGHPILKYDAVYPASAGDRAGSPVLQMVDKNNNIVATDLTAIIAPPFDPPPAKNYAEPARNRAYREFTIHYHEVNDAVQAFPEYYGYVSTNKTAPPDPSVEAVMNAGEDNFAINYGTGGIGSEVLANRLGIGPEGGCSDCKFEEFFLSSWAVGDPAEVVDPGTEANRDCTTQDLKATALNNPTPPNCEVSVGATNGQGYLVPKRKAKRVMYPGDPSNVYHSYIDDHVIFRILHGGSVNTHVHHQHAHQWLHSENSEESTYLDSQMITMGAAYTLNIAYNGGGNRNKTVGDSIFHCHFYPHFAAGMWSLWRTHDVFEGGTVIPPAGQPVPEWNRSLPDGEIAGGTPIPAIVPLPDMPMAPVPARVKLVPVTADGVQFGNTTAVNPDDLKKGLNPGYPFFIPGIGGSRGPHPPLDFAVDNGKELNGGLPRHIIFTGVVANEQHDRYDFSKDLKNINAMQLPEDGTATEKVAMKYHSVCFHNTFFPNGTPGKFRTNGLPPAHGAPFADPALDPAFENENREDICDANNHAHPLSKEKIRHYRAAVFQTDLVLNKIGWHFPQSRMLSLWSDVLPTLGVSGQVPRSPQPFFFRTNSGEAVEYWHTNLVPAYYLLDDYQVRTPTDIIGQHIHLVKFDVTASDGAGNGFNYEDGTFSPEDVQDRIKGMNECKGLLAISFDPAAPYQNIPNCTAGTRNLKTPQAPPAEICKGIPKPNEPLTNCPPEWMGAQTTVQRWFADPLLNRQPKEGGVDRTIRTVFTHDHFGPSTHQQTGLYAALVVEPAHSKWYDNETGAQMGVGRADGGPTSWQAVIETPRVEGQTDANTYREFAMAMADTQLAYTNSSNPKPITTSYSPNNPTWGETTAAYANQGNVPLPVINPQGCAPGVNSKVGPCPSLVSSGGTTGTISVNYRNEPLPPRVAGAPSPATPPLAPQFDLAYVFASLNNRSNALLNTQPAPGSPIGSSGFVYPPPLTGGLTGPDPYTALLRAYEGDNVQIRLIAGAHVLPHTFGVNGVKWLFEPGTPADPKSVNNSGYKNLQAIGISEHYELLFKVPRTAQGDAPQPWVDYLYRADQNTSAPGLSDGPWGLMRAYHGKQADLRPLPNNSAPKPLPPATGPAGYSCPPGAAIARHYKVTAIPASQSAGAPFTIMLNSRQVQGEPITSNIKTPTQIIQGLMFVDSSVVQNGKLPANFSSEPLLLRANAGDCVQVDLYNGIDLTNSTSAAQFLVPKTVAPFIGALYPNVNLYASTYVGMTPQVMTYDATSSNGQPVGFNSPQVAAPGQTVTYYWYAGNLEFDNAGKAKKQEPVELGGLNVMPPDPLFQNTQGLFAGMVVEPQNTTACLDFPPSRVSARIYSGTLANCPAQSSTTPKPLFHEFVSMNQDDMQNSYGATTNDAINYRVEPILFRYGQTSGNQNFLFTNDISCAVSNALINSDPQTPVFQARRGEAMRLRMLHPGGSGNEQVMTLHGHAWQEEPFTNNSRSIGFNAASNALGSRDEHGPNDRFELVARAGGTSGVAGDYFYRTFPAADFQGGMWGIVRVCDVLPCPAPPKLTCPTGAATATTYNTTTAAPSPSSAPAVRSNQFRKRGQREPLQQHDAPQQQQP